VKVCLQPVGSVRSDVIGYLRDKLGKIFGECEIFEEIELPKYAYNPKRNQYNSSLILMRLPTHCSVTLGITEADLYAYTFNFIFGEAELKGKRAIISLARLDPEFYGHEKNDELLKVRALKEAMHEIGHVLGLVHCGNRRCVMCFSNTIFDTDYKDWKYCERCLEFLRSKGLEINLEIK